MRDVDQVLASIDGVLDEDGYDGDDVADGDAMRWAPPWDEPVVVDPESFLDELVTWGWDGHAATAYPTAARRTWRTVEAAMAGSLARVPLLPEPRSYDTGDPSMSLSPDLAELDELDELIRRHLDG